MKAIKVSLICCLGFAITFSLFSLLFYFGDWTRFLVVTLFGFFIGLIAAPEIEPKAFKMAWLVQLVNGLFAGGIIGWFFQLTPENITVTIIIGGFLGWLAAYWIKHVSIP